MKSAQMQGLVRDGMKAGALGLSVSRNQGHFDPQGVHIPAIWADEKEMFALGDVLRELGTGLIQSGGGNGAEMKDALMSRLSRGDRPRRRLQQSRPDDAPPRPVAEADGAGRRDDRQGHPRLPDVHAEPHHRLFPDAQHPDLPRHGGVASDLPVEPRGAVKAYADPEVRRKLHEEAVEFKSGPAIGICSTWWDYMVLQTAVLEKNKQYENMTLGQIAKAQGKGIIDCFLDLAIEENLNTEWLHGENNVDDAAVAKILTYPNAVIGLSDGGAHVQFQSGFGFSTRLLSEWVREKKIMSLETAVRRLTFESASIFGLYDRGLLRPGMVADIVIFDPDTVKPLPLEVVHDFPAGAKRIKEPAQGIHMTIVNGQVLIEDGKHTGTLPGRVLRNTYYKANHA